MSDKKQAIINTKQQYYLMCGIISYFCKLANYSKEETEGLLINFDVLLQYSLIEVSLLDNNVTEVEKVLIKEITDYGDLATFMGDVCNTAPFAWEPFFGPSLVVARRILDMCEPHIAQNCEELLNLFALCDALSEHDYYEDFKNCFCNLLNSYLEVADSTISPESIVNNCLFLNALSEINNRKIDCEKRYKVNVEPSKPKKNSLKENFVEKIAVNTNSKNKVGFADKELAIAYIETDLGSGSGFMIDSNGICFTCNHVINGAKEIYVRIKDNNKKECIYTASIKYQSEENDFALLKLKKCKGNYFFELDENSGSLESGHHIAVYGYPFGSELNDNIMELAPTLTIGYIASKNKVLGKACYYLDVNSSPGNSGGPVFSLETKQVVGYLCGSYGADNSNIIYMRSLVDFFTKCV